MLDLTDRMRSSLVQVGWAIFSRDGEHLGDVLGAVHDRLLLPEPGEPEGRLELPTALVLDEDPVEMRARISLDAAEVGAALERDGSMPRPAHGER